MIQGWPYTAYAEEVTRVEAASHTWQGKGLDIGFNHRPVIQSVGLIYETPINPWHWSSGRRPGLGVL